MLPKSIISTLFFLSFITFLNLIWPQIVLSSRTCPRGCDCIETLLITNCSEQSQLEYIPHTLNPALKKLYLARNNIRRIDSTFNVYEDLVYLDLSSNLITTIVDNNLKHNSKLETILLRNNTVVSLRPEAFIGLNMLKVLDLSHNRIAAINDSLFKNLHSLQVLDLSYNYLKMLNDNTFVGLKNLLFLNISNNLLMRFSTDLFVNLPKLVNLNASFNILEQLEDNWFRPLNELTVLDLSSCHLVSLSPFCFNGLDNLTILHLNNNSLLAVPSSSFLPKNTIQYLNIGQNPFPFLHPRSFYNLKHLRRLYISNAPSLSKIHVDTFLGLENLEILEVSNNPMLKNIDRNIFDNLYSISSLILHNNSFQSLEIDLITRYNKYDLYLDVRGNPFNCNCSLEWLNFHLIRMFNKTISSNPDYFINQNISFPIYNMETLLNNNASEIIMKQNALDVRCSTPFALKDKYIIKLHKDKFGCFILESIVPIIIGGIIGLIIVSGFIILLVLQCRNQLSGFVKEQFDNPKSAYDIYPKPEFVFMSNYTDFTKPMGPIPNFQEEFAIRRPLRYTPTTEL